MLLQRNSRRGISLMEVLVSVFVISIGLLSVVTLLPLGHYQTKKGTTADRGASTGRAALRTFKARDMGNPANWILADGNPVPGTIPPDATNASSPFNSTVAFAYCIDPRMIAQNASASTFPAGGSPTMTRVSLRSQAGGGAMSAQMADLVFRGEDDLSFEVPDDKDQPPVQQAVGGKRGSEGRFSWLATLVREGAGEDYTLSIVVMESRDSTLALNTEHKYTCTLQEGGLGGGEATLTSSGGADPDHLDNVALSSLNTGQWVLVAGGTRFKWYRVTGAGGRDDLPARSVTLHGEDWDGGAATGAISGLQATILPDVVAVYQRKIKLHSSSLWQP